MVATETPKERDGRQKDMKINEETISPRQLYLVGYYCKQAQGHGHDEINFQDDDLYSATGKRTFIFEQRKGVRVRLQRNRILYLGRSPPVVALGARQDGLPVGADG